MILPITQYDFATVCGCTNALLSKYPALKKDVFGYSLQERELFSLTVGGGEDTVLYVAAFHGLEWISSYVALRFVERLCCDFLQDNADGDPCAPYPEPSITAARVVVVPCINPDGVEISIKNPELKWSANARGVDLNHNFDAGWETLQKLEWAAGITAPAPRRYGGPYPHSEPETQAIAALTQKLKPQRVFALHSQGEEIFWEYGGYEVPQAREFAHAIAKASGYRLVKNGGLASHGGYKDWFIKTFRRPGFTIELGKGENPLPLADFARVYAGVEEGLMKRLNIQF
ncbi:MAG: M14 family metallocarboxypeptidase [Oscillospiraceae bacterium]|nr:M14 family metallocarboxypeptidase [Oscillospiraceae bacterium]